MPQERPEFHGHAVLLVARHAFLELGLERARVGELQGGVVYLYLF